MPSYTIRPATADDAALIAHHRVAMFVEMGQVPTAALAASLAEASGAALRAALRDGSYVGWLAVAGDGRTLAGAGAHLKTQLPRMSPDGLEVVTSAVPLVVNVYTEPAARHRGIARALMKTLMHWGSAQGFDRLLLHASDAGRPLYVSLGWSATNEMRWDPRGSD